MQAGFLIKILPWKTETIFKQLTITIWVFVGQVGTEGVGVFPTPDQGVVAYLVNCHRNLGANNHKLGGFNPTGIISIEIFRF